ncbi:MAG: hypothetical protein CVU87_09035 [Firmicutes bacterium HGW-Firmicutes-12]|jgi:hypothetical protein|nr:MAG: hypothetical protein CVU87_09035 [Firmicutes bacterium HGW-Firmicutes-12]
MKKVPILVLFLLLLIALTGCNTEKYNNPEMIEKMINKTIEETQQAIVKKDIKMIRNLWGQISEYGIKADEIGEKRLAESIGQLASTYVYLVEYIEKGDKKLLGTFNKKYEQAIVQLKEQVELNKKIEKNQK